MYATKYHVKLSTSTYFVIVKIVMHVVRVKHHDPDLLFVIVMNLLVTVISSVRVKVLLPDDFLLTFVQMLITLVTVNHCQSSDIVTFANFRFPIQVTYIRLTGNRDLCSVS